MSLNELFAALRDLVAERHPGLRGRGADPRAIFAPATCGTRRPTSARRSARSATRRRIDLRAGLREALPWYEVASAGRRRARAPRGIPVFAAPPELPSVGAAAVARPPAARAGRAAAGWRRRGAADAPPAGPSSGRAGAGVRARRRRAQGSAQGRRAVLRGGARRRRRRDVQPRLDVRQRSRRRARRRAGGVLFRARCARGPRRRRAKC